MVGQRIHSAGPIGHLLAYPSTANACVQFNLEHYDLLNFKERQFICYFILDFHINLLLDLGLFMIIVNCFKHDFAG